MKRRQGTRTGKEEGDAAGKGKKLSKWPWKQFVRQDKVNQARSASVAVIASAFVQCTTELVQIHTGSLLETENQKLWALLARKDAENGALIEKINQLEGNLVRETAASRIMALERIMLTQVVEEQESEIQQLKKALRRKERILSHTRSAADVSRAPVLETQKDKVVHLFPDVLKIIIDKERREDNSISWESLRPLLTSGRIVCKSWKDSVDRILQQDSSHLNPRSSWSRVHVQYFTPLPLRISYDNFDYARWTAKLQMISSYLQQNPGYNPIPSRHLLIISTGCDVYLESQKWTNFSKMVKRFLQLVGKQVWHLTIRFVGTPRRFEYDMRDRMAVYKCLSEWFSLVPNLRSLALYTWITLAKPGSWKETLGKMIFPSFEDLVTFEGFLDTHLNSTILSNNKHVKNLRLVPRFKYYTAPSPGLMEIDLPNLSTFECEFYDALDWTKFANGTSWKLEDLSVQFYGPAAVVEPSAKQFAEGVSKFGNTLKNLSFQLSELHLAAEKLELNLPQLRNLSLEVKYCGEGLHLEPLLVSLKALETFSLELRVFPGIYPRSQYRPLAFTDYVNNFRDKFDWMKLPKLRNVKLSVKFMLADIGERDLFVVRRMNMPSVKFSLVKIDLLDATS